MMKQIIISISTLSIYVCLGCATAHKMNRIALGMKKAEVIEILGSPASTSATSGVEYMNYQLSETKDEGFMGITRPYFVRIVDGKVESFGRTGDFDSTKTPTSKVEVEYKK